MDICHGTATNRILPVPVVVGRKGLSGYPTKDRRNPAGDSFWRIGGNSWLH